MDGFFTTLTLSFSPQIFFAILGGCLGASYPQIGKEVWVATIIHVHISSYMFSAAMGEYLYLTRGVSPQSIGSLY